MSDPRVRIVSDGTPGGTQVYIDGKALDCTRVEWSCGIDGPAEAKITILGPELECEGPVAGFRHSDTPLQVDHVDIVDKVVLLRQALDALPDGPIPVQSEHIGRLLQGIINAAREITDQENGS